MKVKKQETSFYQELIEEIKKSNLDEKALTTLKRELSLKYKLTQTPNNIQILLNSSPQDFLNIKNKLLTKPVRSISGVAPIAIMTKPYPCPHAINGIGPCAMCPGGVESFFGDVPQSYTGKEPATMRAIRNKYDAYFQVFNRLEQYIILGHNCEKVELIIMGGTFPSFPKEYQEEFITSAFQAMNDFSKLFYNKKQNDDFKFLKFKDFFELPSEDIRDIYRTNRIQSKLTIIKKKTNLQKEQKRNETSKIKCVALCIETRPDYGLLKQGNEMLALGCTRVELGIQSVYDKVLKRINRGHNTQDTIKSIQVLKDLGFKVAGHYMPGLPELDYQQDLEGMKQLFSNPDYRPDMLKIYPCMVTQGTKLYLEYKEGKFNPINTDQAAKLIAEFKKYVPEYCRIMRIQRDIPTNQTIAGVDMTNLRQYMTEKYHPKCRCIRCREPKDNYINWDRVIIKVSEYPASNGKEYFISAEDSSKDILIGFVRMRFPSQYLRKEITAKSALIRELHVYGTATGIGNEGNIQHKGWGKKLMQKAEEIALQQNKDKIIVISGVGVREYYRKIGYKKEGPYMVKKLKNYKK